MPRPFLLLRFTLLLLFGLAAPVAHAQRYLPITDLGSLGQTSVGRSVNDSGQVTGYYYVSGTQRRAFLYSAGQMTDIGTLGGDSSLGYSINNAGQIAGSAEYASGNTAQHPFLFSGGVMTDLTPGSGTNGEGFAINATGSITGEVGEAAWKYAGGNVEHLPVPVGPQSRGYGINAQGDVAGFSLAQNANALHAYVFSQGQAFDLGTLGGDYSFAYAINAYDQVVGTSYTSGYDSSSEEAFFYSGGQMIGLGTLGGPTSEGYSINDSGQIVGAAASPSGYPHAFLWKNGSIADLNSRIDPALGWLLVYAYGISNNGYITGEGNLNQLGRAYRIQTNVPVPVWLAFTPNPVVYGQTTTGVLTLSKPAPSGGASVYLNDPNFVGYIPISEGQTSAVIDESFTGVTTSAVPVAATLNGITIVASVVINPIPVSVTFSPSVITLGSSTSVNVTLSNPAPAGGQVVTLTQNGANAGTLTIPAGQTGMYYTLSPTTLGTVPIAAACNGTSASGSLTVAATSTPVPASLVFNPNPVSANQTTYGTVTLSGPAPVGGQAVTITQDGQTLLTFAIAAGQTSATFWTSYFNGSGGLTYQMAVTCNGSTVTTPLSIVAVPVKPVSLSFSPTTVAPGGTTTGTVKLSDAAASAGQVLTLTVNGASAGTVTVPTGTNHTTFPITLGTELAGHTVLVTASCGGGTVSASLSIAALAPKLTGISPSSAAAGTAGLTLTLTGTGFVAPVNGTGGSVARWEGVSLPTTFVSTTQITASVPASYLAQAGSEPVTVYTPSPGGGTSSALTFTIIESRPVAVSLDPSSTAAGGPDFTLSVTGANFTPTCAVQWNGTALPTSYVSPTQLTATVAATLITTGGSPIITVKDTLTGSGASAGIIFTVVNPIPTLSSITPSAASVGGTDITLTVNGSDFVSAGTDGYPSGSLVLWNGQYLNTTYVSSKQLTAIVPAFLLASTGTVQISVSNSGPGGGTSTALPFVILDNRPTVSAIDPASTTAGGPSFTLTLTGANFTPTCMAHWNGQALTTTYISSTQLSAIVPAAYISGSGYAYVSVQDNTTGANSQSSVGFVINSPVPALTAISPASAPAGSGTLTLILTGTGFTQSSYGYGGYLSGSFVLWNGQYLNTTYVSPTQLTATVPASYLASSGTAQVTVNNPSGYYGNGGLASNALPFTITVPDTIAPTTTVSLSGTAGASGWYTSTVQITLSATDNAGGSGVATTYYTLDGGAQQTYSAPFNVTGDGTHTVTFYSVDAAGNTESTRLQTVNIDTTPPATAAFVNGATVTLSASDRTSGVAATYYMLDGGGQQTYSAPFVVVRSGAHTVQFWSVDIASNTEAAKTQNVAADTTAPTTTASLSGTAGTNGWYQSAVQVTLSATDNAGVGVASTFYTLDGGAQQTYSAPFSVTGDSSHTVQFWSVDNVGNTEARKTQTVKIDATPPTLTSGAASPAPNAAGWNNSVVNLPYTASDATSGVASATPGSPLTFASEGTHQTQKVTVTDNAGNSVLLLSPAVNIDRTAPTTTASVSGIAVTLSATDAISGVAATVYTIDAGPQTSYSSPFTVTGTGAHTISFGSTDIAGNTETAHSLTVTVAPITVLSLTLSPATVKGGATTSTGTITLSGPAPTGGVAVKQTSSDTSAATLAATLNIPTGATSAKFKITTYVVSATKTVTITSALNGSSQTAALTVTGSAPLTVSGLSLAPASVPGGAVSTATVTLSAAAPTGGTPVTLVSSDTASATVPASVTVAAGQTTATFSVTGKTVTSVKTPIITATLGASSQAATLTVNPPVPAITVVSLTLSPTSVKGGAATSTGTITLSAPAPTGGVAVKQTSSDTSAATLTATLNIPAGATSAKFKITTLAVSSTKTVTITSALNGTSKTAILTVTH